MQISLTNMLQPSPAVIPRSAFFPFPHKTVEKKRRYHDGSTVFSFGKPSAGQDLVRKPDLNG